jgi:chemotaxis protein MotB
MVTKGGKVAAGGKHGSGHGKDDKPKIIFVKAKGHGEGHHGGAWKVAYADFVTAMMALFLVLWLLASANSTQKSVVAQYFREPGVFSGSRGIIPNGGEDKLGKGIIAVPSLEVMHAQLKEGLAGIKDLGDIADQVPIEITADGLQIEIIDKEKLAFFDLNNATIKPVMHKVLDLISKQIKEAPNKITISGHTDARGYHNDSFYSNWELSSARALNTRRALEDAGVASERFVQVVGNADRKLRVPDDPLAPENRRITILIMRLDKNAKTSQAAPAPAETAKPEAKDAAPGHQPGTKAKPAEPQATLSEHTQGKLEEAEPGKTKP